MRETKTLARWCNLLSINSLPNTGVASPRKIHVTTQTLYALVRTLFDPIACTRLPMSLPHPTTHELQKAAAATLHAPAWLKTNFGGARSRRDRPGD